jgi:signal transduction histidine kinase
MRNSSEKGIDSLREGVRQATTDSARAFALNELAFAYRYSAPDSMMHHAQAAQTLAVKAGVPTELARALQLIGYGYDNQGKYDRAFETYTQALALAREAGHTHYIALTLNFMGNLDRRMGRYERALEEFTEALKLLQTLHRTASCALMMSNIGMIQDLQGHLEAAFASQWRAKHVLDSLHHADVIIALQRLGSLYVRQNKLPQAVECFTAVLAHRDTAAYKRFVATSLCSLGYVCAISHKPREAASYTRRGLQALQEVGARHELQTNYKLVADAYAALNNAPQALAYYRKYAEMKDSLLSDEQQHRINHLQEQLAAALATAAHVQEIQHLKQTSQEQAIVRNSFMIGFVLVLALALVVLNQYRLKHRSEALLQQQNEEITRQRDALTEQSRNIATMNDELHTLNTELDAKNVALKRSVEHVNTLNRTLADANAHLHHLNQEKNELLGVVAHDLKNPLTSILLGLESLLRSESKFTEAVRASKYQGLIAVVERMNHIINHLLDVKTAESGLASLHLEGFDVRHSISALVHEYTERAASKEIALHWAVPQEAIMVYANEHLTLEIVDNLISNALKYSPRGSRVEVRLHSQTATSADNGAKNETKRRAEEVVVSVQDSGPGISDSDKLRLFEKFARLSAQPTGGEHSTGLGLSIVKKLAEAMNGRVWCDSELGAGATFYVALPSQA